MITTLIFILSICLALVVGFWTAQNLYARKIFSKLLNDANKAQDKIRELQLDIALLESKNRTLKAYLIIAKGEVDNENPN